MHGGWVIEDGAVGVVSSYAGGKSVLLPPGKKICLSYILVLDIGLTYHPQVVMSVANHKQSASRL